MAYHISISNGNSKMGLIKSVSLPPVVTCASGCPCAKDCYACKLQRVYKNVGKAWQRNLDILNSDRDDYFSQVKTVATMERFFRWHVSGDIVDRDYFERMVTIANELPHTNFLVFTKRYDIINGFMADGGQIPENLKVIFSGWNGFEMVNPYSFPESQVIFKDTVIDDSWKICGGNCSECACRGVGCWELKKGETIAFYKH